MFYVDYTNRQIEMKSNGMRTKKHSFIRRGRKAVTLVELIVAMTIMAIIFAAIIPQLSAIRSSWATNEATSTIIQNGRVLEEHINRNISAAKQIVSVSPSSTINGFIIFKDASDVQKRYMVSDGNVVFGTVGSEEPLAGPVSRFQVSSYLIDSSIGSTTLPTTDANHIRLVKVDTDFTNSNPLGSTRTFTAYTYLQSNKNTGIIGYWKLDETSGTTAADSSGSGNNGTLDNMASPSCWTTTPGPINGALTFDGTDDYVDLGTDSSLNFGSSEPFTVAAWVKTTEDYGMIVSFRSSTDGGPVIDMAVGYEGADSDPGKAMILVRQDNGGGGYAHVTGGSVKDGLWHHLAVVRGSGSTIELFVDGVSKGTSSGSESGGAITTNLRAIGSERRWVSDGYGSTDQRYLVGTIDDVRIYNRAFTPAEIAELANVLRCSDVTNAPQSSDTTFVPISTPTTTNTGDLLIAAVVTGGDTSGSIAPVSQGWTLIDRGSNGAVTLGAWWKIAGESEPSTHNFTWSESRQAYGWMMRFTGQDTTSPSPINTSQPGNDFSATPTSPAVNTTVPNCLILRLGAFDNSDVNTLPESGPGLSGHTAITMETSGCGSGSSGSVGWWKLNEPNGTTTAADSSGKGNNGTLVNMDPATDWVAGKIGRALDFDGSNDYVDLGTGSSLNFGSSVPFTVAAWVKTTENYGMIVSFRSSTDGGPVIDLAVGYEGADSDPGKAMILVRQDNGGGGYAHVTGGSVKDGLWHHLAAVRGSGSTIELFVDGVSQGTNSGSESGGAITTNLRAIGSERRWDGPDNYGSPDQRYLVGTIDDVRIYNRALTQAEITALHNGEELGGSCGGSGNPVSGGAGYIKQSTAGSSETSNFTLGSSNKARMLTIAIAPASTNNEDGIRP